MSLRIAAPKIDGLTISNGKLEGILAEYVYKKFYLPRNFTVENLDNLNGTVEDLLTNRVELIYSLSSLPELPVNLTTGPVFSYLRCFFLGKNLVQEKIQRQTLQDTLIEVDPSLKIFFGSFFCLLILCWRVFDGSSWTRTIWSMISRFLNNPQSSQEAKFSERAILTTIILFIFSSQIFLSCLIQTNRFTQPEGIRIETFDDIIKFNFTMGLAYTGKCKLLFKKSPISSKKYLTKHLYEGPNLNFIEWLRDHPKLVFLIDESYAACGKEMACLMGGKLFGQLVQSSHSPLQTPQSQYFRKNLSMKKFEQLTRWGYASLEMGFNKRERDLTVGIIQNSLRAKASPTCTTIMKLEIGASALDLNFHLRILHLYLFVSLLSSLIFAVHLIKNKE